MPIMIARRLWATVAVILALVAVVFVLREVSPVDPVRAMVGDRASGEVVANARHQLGMDQPLLVQYVKYLWNMLKGDMGVSSVTRNPVSTDLMTFLPATLELVIAVFVLALAVGTFLGVAMALRWPGSGVLRFLMVGGSSLPVFMTALIAILIFYSHLGWLPATGRSSIADAPTGPTGFLTVDGLINQRPDVTVDALFHLAMPAACLMLVPAVSIGRVLRSSLTQALRSDYARTARAKGLTELAVVLKHSMRNSVGPALSMAGVQLAGLFGAEVLVEMIFGWPGLGLYTTQAINKGDFTTIAGVTIVLGVLYVVGNTVVDICQVIADPRVQIA